MIESKDDIDLRAQAEQLCRKLGLSERYALSAVTVDTQF